MCHTFPTSPTYFLTFCTLCIINCQQLIFSWSTGNVIKIHSTDIIGAFTEGPLQIYIYTVFCVPTTNFCVTISSLCVLSITYFLCMSLPFYYINSCAPILSFSINIYLLKMWLSLGQYTANITAFNEFNSVAAKKPCHEIDGSVSVVLC